MQDIEVRSTMRTRLVAEHTCDADPRIVEETRSGKIDSVVFDRVTLGAGAKHYNKGTDIVLR